MRSITKIAHEYDEKYMKIKVNSYNELSLNKAIEIPSMKSVVRAAFNENSKYYTQSFLR